ncbi:uncharacterized protein LOC116505806 [Thamnophis elegans]|uniref:uncharacterized protein LOC116505806 n=1 Tax=Thamnophis elegans TaxID=35005 RepID=UPI001376B8C4|nr:uncharacterized protein LOC116505806 [Thamnophis elegans]
MLKVLFPSFLPFLPPSFFSPPPPFSITSQSSLISSGKVRIIPFDHDLDREEDYDELGKQLIEDFLEKRARNWQEGKRPRFSKQGNGAHLKNSRSPHKVSVELARPEAPSYPVEYDTIDRRRKKKQRDIAECEWRKAQINGQPRIPHETLISGSTRRIRTGRYNDADLYGRREIGAQQPGCTDLLPYRNTLLVQSGWLSDSPERNCDPQPGRFGSEGRLQPEEAASGFPPSGALEELGSSSWPEDLEGSPGSDEEGKGEMAHGWYEPTRGALKKHVAFSPGQTPSEGDLSAVDELQCLVETVSEYLAEKEEEISSWEALPKQESRNHGLPIQVTEETAQAEQARTAPAAVEEEKEKSESQGEALSDILGVKDTAQSFFSFLTDKVSSGKTLLTSSVEKFVSSAPELADVPARDSSSQPPPGVEAESRPDLSLPEEGPASLPEQSQAKAAGAASVSLPEASDRDDKACPPPSATDRPADDAEGQSAFQKTSAAVSSLLGMFGSLKTLAEKKEPKKATTKEETAVVAGPSLASGAEARGKPGEAGTKPSSSSLETRKGGPAADLSGAPAPSTSSSSAGVSLRAGLDGVAVPGRPAESPEVPCPSVQPDKTDREIPLEPLATQPPEDKAQEGPKQGVAPPSEPRESPISFFSPLKKCLSLLPLSAPADPLAQEMSLGGVGKQCKSEDDVRKASSFPFPEKLQVSFLSSFSLSDKLPENKEKTGFFSSFLKITSGENPEAPKEGHSGSSSEGLQTSSSKPPPENKEELKEKPETIGPLGAESGPREKVAAGTSESRGSSRRGHSDPSNSDLNGVTGGEEAAAATATSQGGPGLDPAGENSEAVSGVGRMKILADAQEGFFSGLFRSPLASTLSSKEGQDAQDSTAGQKNRSPGLLSGLLRFGSGESPPPGKVEKPNLSFLGGLGQIFEKNVEETNSKEGDSQAAPQTQEGTKDPEGAGSFLRNVLHQAKEKVEERVAQAPKMEAGLPSRGKESVGVQAGPVSLKTSQKKTDLSTKPSLSRKNTEPRIHPGVLHENVDGFLRCSSRNANLLNWPGEPPASEEIRRDSPLDSGYDPRGCPAKTVQTSVPLYYVSNQKPVSWDEVLTLSESSNTVMNLCKRDGNADPTDWRSSENFDPAVTDFNAVLFRSSDFCLGGNEMWASPYLNGSLSPHWFNCILEDGPVDLSYSSAYGANVWTLIDQEFLDVEDPWLGACQGSLDWLMPLLEGVWWPSEDGDYGYYIYTDGQYVYSLLTDSTGQYIYICTSDIYPHPDSWEDCDLEGSLQRVVSDGDLVSICGFKVPLEDELFWSAEEEEWDDYFVNKPLDLSVAFQRSDKFMNVETFSQMFEESAYHQKEKPLDFSGYRLLKPSKVGFRPEEKREGSVEDVPFDLRAHFRMASGRELKEELLDVAPRTSVSESQQTKPSGFQIFKAAAKSDLPPVCLAEAPAAEEDKRLTSNKVSSWLSALGGLMGQGSGKDAEVLEEAAEKDQGPQPKFPPKEATSGTPPRKKGAGPPPEPLSVSPAREEAAAALSPTQTRAPLRRSASQSSQGLTSDTFGQLDNYGKVAAGSLGEPENTWPVLSQIAAKTKETLSKGDLKTGSPREEPPAPAEAGFLGFFRMQGSKPPSQPSPAPQPHPVANEAQSQAEPPGAPSSFFGSIKGFFSKEPAPSLPDTPVPPLSNGQIPQELVQEPPKSPASEVSVSPEAPGADVAKKDLFPKEEPQEKAGEETAGAKEAPPAKAEQGANSHASPGLGRRSPAPEEGGLLRSLSGLLGDSAAKTSSSLSSSWSSLMDKGQQGVSSGKVQPEKARQPPEEPGFRLPFGLSQAAPPKSQETSGRWDIYSLFPASKKAPPPAPAPAPVPAQTARGPEAEGLFKMPFTAKKGLPESSSFSFFSWASFRPEEPPSAPDKGHLAKPPPSQGKEGPLLRPSVSADAGVGMARKPVVEEEKGSISRFRDAVLGKQEAYSLQNGAREASVPVAKEAGEGASAEQLTASPCLSEAKEEDQLVQPDPACEGPEILEDGTFPPPEIPGVSEQLPQSPTERDEKARVCLSQEEAASLPDGNEAFENTEPPVSPLDQTSVAQRRSALQDLGQEGVPEPLPGLDLPPRAGTPQTQGQEPLPKAPLGELGSLKMPGEATSNKSVLDSSMEKVSSFFTKIKPTKTFSDFLGSPLHAPDASGVPKKSTSFFGSAFQAGGPPTTFTGGLFGFSKGAAEQPSPTPSKASHVDSGVKDATGSVPGKGPPASQESKAGGEEGSGAGKEQDQSPGGELLQTEATSALKEEALLNRQVDLQTEANQKPDIGQEPEPNARDTWTSEKSQRPEGGQVDFLYSDERRDADTCGQDLNQTVAAEFAAVPEESQAGSLEELAGTAAQKTTDLESQTGTHIGQEGWENTPELEAKTEDDRSQSGVDTVATSEHTAIKTQADLCPQDGGESLGVEAGTVLSEIPDLQREDADSVRDLKQVPVEEKEVSAISEKAPEVEALGSSSGKGPAGPLAPEPNSSSSSVFEMLSKPPWPKFSFGSSTGSTKRMGSFFSPAAGKSGAEPGLGSGLSSVSSVLFGGGSDEKAEKTGSLQETVFGRKLDFSLPWQKGPKEKEAKKEPEVPLKPSSKREAPPDGPSGLEPSAMQPSGGPEQAAMGAAQLGDAVPETGLPSVEMDSSAQRFLGARTAPAEVDPSQGLEVEGPEQEEGLGAVPRGPPAPTPKEEEEAGDTASIPGRAEQKDGVACPEEGAHVVGLRLVEESSPRPPLEHRPVANAAHKWRRPVHL